MNKTPFINTYAKLPADFYTKMNPIPVKNPELISFNQSLAKFLGLGDISKDKQMLAQLFSGNKLLAGTEPLAMVYAGHQFGGFAQQLGDGRAMLLGEVQAVDGERYDIQLKGSGPTPYSRGGDGRSALGPVIREYILSEAMAKLGVPTTRALAAVTSGEEVARERLVPGGILTRVARGFVRVGTFEFFAARSNSAAVKQLADYEIERHYPEVLDADNPYVAFFQAVVNRQASLIANWMQLGFIHGVMNTDNMSIAGETIDYGPCAFMDEFSRNQVFSSIDRNGRYAYGNQPQIGQWNLVRLAEALLPLFGEGDAAVIHAQDILNSYPAQYQSEWLAGMRKKVGLTEQKLKETEDIEIIEQLLTLMENNQADFTLSFYYLSQLSDSPANNEPDTDFKKQFNHTQDIESWLVKWRHRLTDETRDNQARQASMRAVNPVYIPRNHQVEAAIGAAEDDHDFSVFQALHDVLQQPYTQQPGKEQYMLAPRAEQKIHQTFCGT